MNEHTYRRLLLCVAQVKMAAVNLETGLQLAHELQTTGRIDRHDAEKHVTDALADAQRMLNRAATFAEREFAFERETEDRHD